MENKYKYSTKNDPRNAEGYPENISPYQPTDAEKQTLIEMNADLQTGNTNLNIPYLELDNRTLQMAFYDFYRSFIGFTQTHASQDPESQWQSYLHKPYIMNKSQVFIGQAMANMVSPYWYAKNQNNEIAEMEANVIQALSDQVFEDITFIEKMVRSVTAVCYMPYVIVRVYNDGKKNKFKMVDMTTFKFSNFYEADIQNQRFVIEDELVDFWEMDAIYKNHPNWKYVTPGNDIYFDVNTQLFLYRQDGDALKNLVHRRTWYSKALNKEIITINGVMLCDPNRPIQRIGKKNDRPYPFATVIFEQFGRDTIAGRTLAQKLWADERLASRLQSMAFDMTKQAVVPSVVAYGAENLTARIFAPGAVINAGNNDNFRISPVIDNSKNLGTAYNMLNYIDNLADNASHSDALRGGVAQKGIPARNAVIASQNAEIAQLGTFKFNMEKFVRDIGLLVMDNIFQFDLAKDIDQVTNNIQWKSSILLPSKDKGNSTLIRLSLNDFSSEEEKIKAEMLLAEEANKNGYKTIYQINPDSYQQIQYDCNVSVKDSTSRTKEVQQALAVEYDQYMRTNPFYDVYEGAKQVTKFYYPDKVDILLHKPQAQTPGEPAPVTLGQQTPSEQTPSSVNSFGRQIVNNSGQNFVTPGA